MQTAVLYALVVLIWGSTWAAISYQLGPVAAEVSVAYRFAIASLLLFAYAVLSRRDVRIPVSRYPMVVVQGGFLFSANYFFVYYATAHVTTGLIAVIFSTIVLCNAFFERLFFGRLLEQRLILGALLGLAGVALLFWPEVAEFALRDRAIAGAAMTLVAVVVASFGNMAAVINTRRSLPVTAVNAHAMAWGAVISAIVAAALGRPFNFSTEPGYVLSLLYLAIFGSAVAFGGYLVLIRTIGSARAAYSSVLFPLVALAISTVLEGYRWTAPAYAGMALIMAGNWLALPRQEAQQALQPDRQ